MKPETLHQILTDFENQPHQFVGENKRDFYILILEAVKDLGLHGLSPERDYDEFNKCIDALIVLHKHLKTTDEYPSHLEKPND